jgi:hypothetical protein
MAAISSACIGFGFGFVTGNSPYILAMLGCVAIALKVYWNLKSDGNNCVLGAILRRLRMHQLIDFQDDGLVLFP